jgi:hypothetical protein
LNGITRESVVEFGEVVTDQVTIKQDRTGKEANSSVLEKSNFFRQIQFIPLIYSELYSISIESTSTNLLKFELVIVTWRTFTKQTIAQTVGHRMARINGFKLKLLQASWR